MLITSVVRVGFIVTLLGLIAWAGLMAGDADASPEWRVSVPDVTMSSETASLEIHPATELTTTLAPTLATTLATTATVTPQPTSPVRKGSGLPARPATRIVIPVMNLDAPVVLAPIISGTWKVDHLGTKWVGHLEGTASPGDPSNVVLAAHVTTAHKVYGPFAGMGRVQPGDEIILYVGDEAFTYIVDFRRLVERSDVNVTYPTPAGQVTLITCNNWSDEQQSYQQRLVVAGHLVTPPATPEASSDGS
jgi:LPXTG-site transpeptidase (sortase) family protein